jgi:hypothetical protein
MSLAAFFCLGQRLLQQESVSGAGFFRGCRQTRALAVIPVLGILDLTDTNPILNPNPQALPFAAGRNP